MRKQKKGKGCLVTLTVHYPTKEFLEFLNGTGVEYAVETISGYPNKDGKHELGTIHVYDYPGNLYEGIIGLSAAWHQEEEEGKQLIN